MLRYFLRRLAYVAPVALGVSFFCFLLVHIAPGDPLTSVLPPDASAAQQAEMRRLYGFDKPLPLQFGIWLLNALQGDLGISIATGRPVAAEVGKAVGNTLIVALLATLIGFALGSFFGFIGGYFKGQLIDRIASLIAVLGVSVPHYWLGMVLVILFSVRLNWLPPGGAGPGGSDSWVWDWEHVRYMILPALTMAVVPMGIIARTIRALVADIMAQDFVTALRAKGLLNPAVLRHVIRNALPTALAVMGLQLGYLLGGSILIETVFSWPGTGFLLGNAIFQRDLPLLQGAILVLAMFFVALNLAVDLIQGLVDPRVRRQ